LGASPPFHQGSCGTPAHHSLRKVLDGSGSSPAHRDWPTSQSPLPPALWCCPEKAVRLLAAR
jgi:hypothetical protein